MRQNGSHKERERSIKCTAASAVGKYAFWFFVSVGSIDKGLFFIECMSNSWLICLLSHDLSCQDLITDQECAENAVLCFLIIHT